MKSLRILGFLSALSLCLLTGRANQTQQLDYDKLKAEAERFYAESSYARAYEIYLKAKQQNLSPAELRWVDFRIADTLWRSQASTQTADSTKLDSARQQLDSSGPRYPSTRRPRPRLGRSPGIPGRLLLDTA